MLSVYVTLYLSLSLYLLTNQQWERWKYKASPLTLAPVLTSALALTVTVDYHDNEMFISSTDVYIFPSPIPDPVVDVMNDNSATHSFCVCCWLLLMRRSKRVEIVKYGYTECD